MFLRVEDSLRFVSRRQFYKVEPFSTETSTFDPEFLGSVFFKLPKRFRFKLVTTTSKTSLIHLRCPPSMPWKFHEILRRTLALRVAVGGCFCWLLTSNQISQKYFFTHTAPARNRITFHRRTMSLNRVFDKLFQLLAREAIENYEFRQCFWFFVFFRSKIAK